MIERKLYGHAALCFEKCGEIELQLKCEAYHIASEAANELEENKSVSIKKFKQAAQKFSYIYSEFYSKTEENGTLREAAHCYFSAEMYEQVSH